MKLFEIDPTIDSGRYELIMKNILNLKEEYSEYKSPEKKINNQNKTTILIFIVECYYRFDFSSITNLLSKEYNVITVYSENDFYTYIHNVDVFVTNDIGIYLLHASYKKNINIFSKKIVILRSNLSCDFYNYVLDPEIFSKQNSKNIYVTLNNFVLSDSYKLQLPIIHRPENTNFILNLLEIGNVTRLPSLLNSNTPRKSKDEFFNKYNLDINKGIFTIFTAFPKNISQAKLPINVDDKLKGVTFDNVFENYLFQNKHIFDKIIQSIGRYYNVVFKPHPLYHFKFKPLTCGKYWDYGIGKRQMFKLKEMKPFLDEYTFIEMEDGHDVNIFTDLGMVICRSSYGYNNYMDNIPLMYLTNKDNLLQKQYIVDLGEDIDLSKICCGKFINIDDLINNCDAEIDDFINEYKNKPPFMYQHDHILYGNYNIEPKHFYDYISNVIEKPLYNIEVDVKKTIKQTMETASSSVPLKPLDKNAQMKAAAKRANMTLSEYRIHRKKIRDSKMI